MKFRVLLLALLAGSLFLLTGCATSSDDDKSSDTQTITFGRGAWEYTYTVKCDKKRYADVAIVKIINKTDRNISLDFDGPEHNEASIGDNRSHTMRLECGEYTIMCSSPGMKFVPGDNKVEFKCHCVYEGKMVIRKESVPYDLAK